MNSVHNFSYRRPKEFCFDFFAMEEEKVSQLLVFDLLVTKLSSKTVTLCLQKTHTYRLNYTPHRITTQTKISEKYPQSLHSLTVTQKI